MTLLTSPSARSRAPRWLIFGASLGSSVLLLAGSTTAFAADGQDRRGEAEHHESTQQVVHTPAAQRQRANDNDDREESRSHAFDAASVVNALNNQVTLLSAANAVDVEDENEADDEDGAATQRVAGATTMSLAMVVTRLSATDAATLTAAVNANAAALQAFLNGGTPAANTILAALNKANINPASVLAILPSRDGQLLVLLA